MGGSVSDTLASRNCFCEIFANFFTFPEFPGVLIVSGHYPAFFLSVNIFFFRQLAPPRLGQTDWTKER